MARDSAIQIPRSNRNSASSVISTAITCNDSARGKAIANKCRKSVAIPRSVLTAMHYTLVEHGIAVGQIEQTANAKGTRIDAAIREWPIDAVKFDDGSNQLLALTTTGNVPIIHGDGTWVVARYTSQLPWRTHASVSCAGLIWCAHAESLADWQAASKVHGMAKLLGQLPDGVRITDEVGGLTAIAQAYVDMLTALAEGDTPAGVSPFGAKAEFISSDSSAWQVFDRSVAGREKAAARLYLGTDATLGAIEGAPGVDVSKMLGVVTTQLQKDFTAISLALNSGLLAPWMLANYGAVAYAPSFRFNLPDPDTEQTRNNASTNYARFAKAVTDLRAAGIAITPERIRDLAHEFGVEATGLSVVAQPSDA
jgi:hypothetical protein